MKKNKNRNNQNKLNNNKYETYEKMRNGVSLVSLIFLILASIFLSSCASKNLVTINSNDINWQYSNNNGNLNNGNHNNEKYYNIIENKYMSNSQKLDAILNKEYEEKYLNKTQNERERIGRMRQTIAGSNIPKKTDDVVIKLLYMPYAENSKVFNYFNELYVLAEEGQWVYPDMHQADFGEYFQDRKVNPNVHNPIINNSNNYGKPSNTNAPMMNQQELNNLSHNSNMSSIVERENNNYQIKEKKKKTYKKIEKETLRGKYYIELDSTRNYD